MNLGKAWVKGMSNGDGLVVQGSQKRKKACKQSVLRSTKTKQGRRIVLKNKPAKSRTAIEEAAEPGI
jgi:hypothetical protein